MQDFIESELGHVSLINPNMEYYAEDMQKFKEEVIKCILKRCADLELVRVEND
jgi:hypothetical protein